MSQRRNSASHSAWK